MTATLETLTLVPLAPSQVMEAVRLRNACADDLSRRYGAGPWSSHGHAITMRALARERCVLVAQRTGRSVATMTLGTECPRVHRPEWFAKPTSKACYLTGLYVSPDEQGRGVGTWMMAQADRIAQTWSCAALRFDAYKGPAGAVPFYRRLGYASRGQFEVAGVWLELFERCF